MTKKVGDEMNKGGKSETPKSAKDVKAGEKELKEKQKEQKKEQK